MLLKAAPDRLAKPLAEWPNWPNSTNKNHRHRETHHGLSIAARWRGRPSSHTGFGRVAALALACGPAAAQDGWPNKPVTLIVPFAAGGGTDAFARPLTAQLDKQLNQRFLIDNRAGAGGTVGAAAAAKAEPNGYNFFVGAAHHAIAPSIYLKLDYDLEKDFVPVILIAAPPQVVTVNPSKVAAKTLAEFIAFAKANPGKVDYASAGRGTTHHLAGELFNIIAGTR